jgi:hypothetical protein
MELTQKLYFQDSEKTIYAKKPWLPESEVEIRVEPQDCLVPDDLEKKGYQYFLEVFIAQEIITNLSLVYPPYTLEKRCEKLINYAENDA